MYLMDLTIKKQWANIKLTTETPWKCVRDVGLGIFVLEVALGIYRVQMAIFANVPKKNAKDVFGAWKEICGSIKKPGGFYPVSLKIWIPRKIHIGFLVLNNYGI